MFLDKHHAIPINTAKAAVFYCVLYASLVDGASVCNVGCGLCYVFEVSWLKVISLPS